MLKIKDNVDLRELIDKYNFKTLYDSDTGELKELYRIEGHFIGEREKRRRTTTISLYENENGKNTHTKSNWFVILPRNRKITPKFYGLKLDAEDFEILYDLIKDGLVEKV